MCADTSANRPLPDAAAVRPSPLGTASTRPARVVQRRAQRVGIAITSDTTRLETSFRVFLFQWNSVDPTKAGKAIRLPLFMVAPNEVVMVNVLGFLGSAPGRSTPGCIAGNAATRRRPLHARRESAPPRDPRVSSPPGRTRAVDGSAAPRPAARPGDPGRSAHRAGTSPSLRHKRFRSSESSLREKSKRRATTKRLRNRKLVLWILPIGWQLPTGGRAVYLMPWLTPRTSTRLRPKIGRASCRERV